ncbi:SCP2 sterol-binding domain-containing protein [Micromonospora sp. SH-82]|uniref:SCP2 sterol-binding domain-containing protein n=1 Tax=Micromonospora sp. SH-82 TaxID=3132938 RepID=UPI003EB94F3A
MTGATEEFFASLPERAPAVLRSPLSGSLRIDLYHGDHTAHWRVEMAPGEARVNRDSADADTTWVCRSNFFDRLVVGSEQAIAAMLRSETTIVGDIRLFLAFRGFLPSPPGTRDPRETARESVRDQGGGTR